MFYWQLQKRLETLDKSSFNDFVTQTLKFGRQFRVEGNIKEARVWILRAGECISPGNSDKTRSIDPTLALMLLQSLLDLPLDDVHKQGTVLRERMFSILDRDLAHSMPYRLTVLEYCTKGKNLSNPEFRQRIDFSLIQFTRLTALSQATFDTIIYYINKLFSVSPERAFAMLQKTLMPRLIDEQNREWIERSLIMMLYIQGKMPKSSLMNGRVDIELLLSEYQQKCGDCISAQGAHACLMVDYNSVSL